MTAIADYSTAGIPLISAPRRDRSRGDDDGSPAIAFSIGSFLRVATEPISVVCQTVSGAATAGVDFRTIRGE